MRLIVICPYVPLTIHAFSTALCGASTGVSFVLSEFTCIVRVSDVAKRCFLKSSKLIVSAGNITSLDSVIVL